MKMYLVGDELTVTGFKLGGIKKTYIADKKNVSQVLGTVDPSARIILVTNSLAVHALDAINKLKKQEKIVVTIPDRTGGGDDELDRLIKEAIGFDLRKR